MKKTKYGLILILFLASFLRLYHLGSYPPLNADEAAIGYNAWSLIQTGRDEHGAFLPLHFKSFGDYKPGGYFYIVLPFVKVLGLNEWAVRLPSALMAILTIYLVYLLAKLLWDDEVLGLVWAFVLAVSPWHIHFSRGGWESNAALFFVTLGVYLFFKFRGLTLSFLSFVFALYIYHSARVVAPALVLGLFVFNYRFLWQRKKELVVPVLLGIFLTVPLAFSFLRGGASARFSGVGLFADSGPVWRVNELRGQHTETDSPTVRLLHNRPLIYANQFAKNYFSHFSGRFLFIEGDEVPRSRLPDMGVVYLFEAVFLAVGVWWWTRSGKRHKYLPFLWLGVAPLASALTFQAPSALRALPMVVPLAFFTAYGIKVVFELKIPRLPSALPQVNGGREILKTLVLVFYAYGLLYWSNQYFVHYLKHYPSAWPDFKPTADWMVKNTDRDKKLCVEGSFDQPYVLTLFYLKYPPEKIQKKIKLTPPNKFGFSTVKHFGRYWFGDCQTIPGVKIVKE